MPCDDITETIRLRFDGEECLQSYSLSKRTCGGGVGTAALLQTYLQGRTIEDILAIAPETYRADRVSPPRASAGSTGTIAAKGPSPPPGRGKTDADEDALGLDEFLEWKHFFAVQIAIEVLTGRASGGVRDRCVVAGVTFDGDELYFEADIPIDLPTERIRSCGACKGCASKKGAPIAATEKKAG